MIILYSTHCPKCSVLEKKMDLKGITYTIEDDIEKMKEMGFKSVPILQIDDGSFLNFAEANKWISQQGE